MARSGALGAFHWVELPSDRYDIPAVVRHLAGEMVGLTAVNVAWDSGRLMPSSDPEASGWREINGLAVSPVLDAGLLADWPVSSCQGGRYDEWYFFRTIDPALQLDPFCNWVGTSLEEAGALAFPGGFDLQAQLERHRPEVVIGEGRHVFVISVHPRIIESARTLDDGEQSDES